MTTSEDVVQIIIRLGDGEEEIVKGSTQAN